MRAGTRLLRVWSPSLAAGGTMRGSALVNDLRKPRKDIQLCTPPQWGPGVSAQFNLLHSVELAKIAHFYGADSTDLKSPEWEINMLLLINV